MRTCVPVGNAGSPIAMFRRALATGNVLMATSAAHEVGRLDLDDALGLTLLFRDKDPARYRRAAVRWHARLCGEMTGVAPEDSQLMLAALVALAGPRPEAGAQALMSVLDSLMAPGIAAVVGDWLNRRSPG